MKHNIKRLGYLLLCSFIVLIVYLTYLIMQQGEALATHPQNRRMAAKEAEILRGTIYDHKGVVLAETKWVGERGQRVYLKDDNVAPFAHLVGFTSERYGSSGLEATYSRELLGLTDADVLENFMDKLFNRRPQGNDLLLTLDAAVQKTAQRALKGKRGAVVAIDPATGAILAMVSSPTYDTNAITEQKVWEMLATDEKNAPLLNRATQGAYPPGSVIKLVTGAGILAHHTPESFECPGYLMVDGQKLVDNRAHGEVDLIEALAVSCNTFFAQEGLKLGWPGFIKGAEQFGLTSSPDIGISIRRGTLLQKADKTKVN
ncbi:hypothetical protein N752_14530 [Desulforamulus aquiferis]|nr:penicillin-binding transpeptidase domain-containing protein [Desulforamulus aquiferis]RYD04586.1 hypothetical protein N752_14530 [Desulforamulus aquiferis]